MKTLYFIRDAKSKWSIPGTTDFERPVSKKGKKNINTMGSYLALKDVQPELILSSCALRAQQTTDLLAEKISYSGKKIYLKELYLTTINEIQDIISIQDDTINLMFIIAHNPQLQELINSLTDEHISKFPSLGIICIDFDIESWKDITETKGKIDFFIFPKQFKYYIPNQIRGLLHSK